MSTGADGLGLDSASSMAAARKLSLRGPDAAQSSVGRRLTDLLAGARSTTASRDLREPQHAQKIWSAEGVLMMDSTLYAVHTSDTQPMAPFEV